MKNSRLLKAILGKFRFLSNPIKYTIFIKIKYNIITVIQIIINLKFKNILNKSMIF